MRGTGCCVTSGTAVGELAVAVKVDVVQVGSASEALGGGQGA